MKVLVVLLALSHGIALLNCLLIECEFKYDYIHDWKNRYTCRSKKFVIRGDERKISRVDGDQMKNHTSVNVTQYFARGLNIERFPGGLTEYFTNLEVVRITSCNMRLVLKDDMANLERLIYLDLVGNKIEKLESDTFANTPNLNEVLLSNNRLQFIGANLLEPLKKLYYIHFGGNVCITGQSKHSSEQLLRLKTEIKLKCSDISMMDVMTRFDGLKAEIGVLTQKLDEISKHMLKGKKSWN